MIVRTATLLCSAPNLEACPPADLPEFALIGRSNVGKSSLVNLLTRTKALAKVSGTPGKTQLINIFAINGQWGLVDLPGYGYAKAAKSKRAGFGALITSYLTQRPNLHGTFVLIDSRLTPQQIDLDFLGWMVGEGLPFILVFTKADKLSRTAVQRNIEVFLTRLQEISAEAPAVIVSSSKLGAGRDEILETISAAISESSP